MLVIIVLYIFLLGIRSKRTSGCIYYDYMCHYFYIFLFLPSDFLDIYVHRLCTKIIDSKQLRSMYLQIYIKHRFLSIMIESVPIYAVHDGIISENIYICMCIRRRHSLFSHIYFERRHDLNVLKFQKSKFVFFFSSIRDSCSTNGRIGDACRCHARIPIRSI